MSQQLRVEREFVIAGQADKEAQTKGNFMLAKVSYDNHFVRDNNASTDWVETTYGSTIAYSTELGGAMKVTTGGTILDLGEFTHKVIWGCAKNCVMEARVKLSAITTVTCVVGFADARHNTNDELAAELSSSTLVAARGTEVAAFIFDTDSAANFWYVGAYKTGTPGTPVVTSIVPTGDTYQNLRVEMNEDGDATFYIDGEAVGFLQTAVTVATLLTPYVAFMARVGGERIGYIDRLDMWQDE